MKNQMNSELILENDQRETNKMRVFPDSAGMEKDLVGFTFSHDGKLLTMCDEPVDGNAQEYFHLDKFNLGCLIDYLKRIYDDMGSAS